MTAPDLINQHGLAAYHLAEAERLHRAAHVETMKAVQILGACTLEIKSALGTELARREILKQTSQLTIQ